MRGFLLSDIRTLGPEPGLRNAGVDQCLLNNPIFLIGGGPFDLPALTRERASKVTALKDELLFPSNPLSPKKRVIPST